MFKKITGQLIPAFIVLYAVLFTTACEKDVYYSTNDARLRFSADTVYFDTLFTTIGSATYTLKIYNPYPRKLLVNSIELAGGESSFFRLNIDGDEQQSTGEVEIPPGDSLFIFIAVTIDLLHDNNPLIIKDSIVFNTNGNQQDVKLIAYGQDVHLLDGQVIGSQTWINDKPYLVYNSLAVDTGATLVIEKGVRLYFHKNSDLVVWGNLIINGTLEEPVIMQNDRPEESYDNLPGQWGSICIDPLSSADVFNYLTIRNSTNGIQIGKAANPASVSLTLNSCTIMNTSYAGIYAFGADVTCFNTVISDCAGPALALLRGGSYKFMHCTISNNGVIRTSRKSPSVKLTNYYAQTFQDPETGIPEYHEYTGDLQQASFENCIIYGNAGIELELDNNGENAFYYFFNHCLIKMPQELADTSDHTHFKTVILNKDPLFINDSVRNHINLQLDTLSPAQNAGDPLVIQSYPFLQLDKNGYPRTLDAGPDLGAFERKEE